jgi:hypothetical protein
MSTTASTEQRTTPATSTRPTSRDGTQIAVTHGPRDLADWDSTEARAYGAASVRAFGLGSPMWENAAPLVRAGWAGRHGMSCDPRHDWRLCWPAVKEGWADAGGAFDPPPRDTLTQARVIEPIVPAQDAHVFDAFGEPAGRVKVVRDEDFLLHRPLARDVYVPFDAIRCPGRMALRIALPNAQLGTMGWQRPKIIGLFGGGRPDPGSGSPRERK